MRAFLPMIATLAAIAAVSVQAAVPDPTKRTGVLSLDRFLSRSATTLVASSALAQLAWRLVVGSVRSR